MYTKICAFLIRYLLIFIIGSVGCLPAFTVEKPPQFVVISFDGGIYVPRWQQLSQFVDTMQQQQKSIHFTFFLSGTTFLTEQNKQRYQGPGQTPGKADIPFGGTQQEVEQRLEYINKFYLAGHEIGSHAVGHFDGTKWTLSNWQDEFNNFNLLFDNIANNNNLDSTSLFAFSNTEIVGFRSPYLSTNDYLYRALSSHYFRYDASGIDNPSDWPKKINGLWRFNLVRLTIAGTNKKTLSMDYEFYVSQSNAEDDIDNQPLYRQQMLETYLDYFYTNYHGNRAPLRIGHHFMTFQNNIYNEALLEFAQQVCGLPEVRCVSFKELADYMDNLPVDVLAAYQKGEFGSEN